MPPGNSIRPPSARFELPMFHRGPPGCVRGPSVRVVSAFSLLEKASAVYAFERAIAIEPTHASAIERWPTTRPPRSTTTMCMRVGCFLPSAPTRRSDSSFFAWSSACARIFVIWSAVSDEWSGSAAAVIRPAAAMTTTAAATTLSVRFILFLPIKNSFTADASGPRGRVSSIPRGPRNRYDFRRRNDHENSHRRAAARGAPAGIRHRAGPAEEGVSLDVARGLEPEARVVPQAREGGEGGRPLPRRLDHRGLGQQRGLAEDLRAAQRRELRHRRRHHRER